MIYESVGETTRREERPRDISRVTIIAAAIINQSVDQQIWIASVAQKSLRLRIGKKKEEFSKQGFSIVASSSSSSSPGGMEIFPRGNFAMKNIRGIDIQIAIDNPNYWFNRARGKFTSIFVS